MEKFSNNTANIETVFRIIQSIPSPKTEPFKRMKVNPLEHEIFIFYVPYHTENQVDNFIFLLSFILEIKLNNGKINLGFI